MSITSWSNYMKTDHHQNDWMQLFPHLVQLASIFHSSRWRGGHGSSSHRQRSGRLYRQHSNTSRGSGWGFLREARERLLCGPTAHISTLVPWEWDYYSPPTATNPWERCDLLWIILPSVYTAWISKCITCRKTHNSATTQGSTEFQPELHPY